MEQEKTYTFAARIQKIWILRCVDLPRDLSNEIRRDAGGKAQHVPVRGWIDGLAMQNTLVPGGGGRYRMHVHSSIWRKLKIDAGAAVEVALIIERERRETPVPADLAAALADEHRALGAFQGLTPAFRRQIIVFLEKAKQAKTREKRIVLIVRRMLERAAGERKPPPRPNPRAKR
jgi:bacteriocin resistance YdeI/OmpD-like protein/uncharacterized protein DUF1905